MSGVRRVVCFQTQSSSRQTALLASSETMTFRKIGWFSPQAISDTLNRFRRARHTKQTLVCQLRIGFCTEACLWNCLSNSVTQEFMQRFSRNVRAMAVLEWCIEL